MHTWGKSPLLQSCRNGLLGLFTFGVLLLCIRRMDRKTLMKSINYSRSILLTVSLLISQPCTFTTHLLTLQEQQGNISPACLCFCSFYGEDIENVINFLALQCSKFAATQVCASPVLILRSRVESRKWECNCLDFLCSARHLFRVYFSTAGEIKQKGRTAAHVQRSSAGWVGLNYRVFIWGVASIRITLSGSQQEFALLYGNVFYLVHSMYPIMQCEK